MFFIIQIASGLKFHHFLQLYTLYWIPNSCPFLHLSTPLPTPLMGSPPSFLLSSRSVQILMIFSSCFLEIWLSWWVFVYMPIISNQHIQTNLFGLNLRAWEMGFAICYWKVGLREINWITKLIVLAVLVYFLGNWSGDICNGACNSCCLAWLICNWDFAEWGLCGSCDNEVWFSTRNLWR